MIEYSGKMEIHLSHDLSTTESVRRSSRSSLWNEQAGLASKVEMRIRNKDKAAKV